MAQRVKSLPAMWEIWVRFLDQEDTLEKEITIHSIILAWKFSWTEEPSGLHTVHGAAKSRTRLSDYHLQHFARMARTQQSHHNIPVLVSGARSPQDSLLRSSVPQLPAASASLPSHLILPSPRRMLASTSMPLLHAPGPKTASRQQGG